MNLRCSSFVTESKTKRIQWRRWQLQCTSFFNHFSNIWTFGTSQKVLLVLICPLYWLSLSPHAAGPALMLQFPWWGNGASRIFHLLQDNMTLFTLSLCKCLQPMQTADFRFGSLSICFEPFSEHFEPFRICFDCCRPVWIIMGNIGLQWN